MKCSYSSNRIITLLVSVPCKIVPLRESKPEIFIAFLNHKKWSSATKLQTIPDSEDPRSDIDSI